MAHQEDSQRAQASAGAEQGVREAAAPSCVKEVTLVVKNMLRPERFEESVTLSTDARHLFQMMIEAAEAKPAFKFTVTYFRGLGFFVDAMNGLAGNYTLDQTWWEILGGNGERTPVGVSFYEPQDGEIVTFNFTQGQRAQASAGAEQGVRGAAPSCVKEVTLVVKNMLRPERFEESVTLSTGARHLFQMMIEAAEAKPAFKFTVTYFKGLGFFVNAMNGLAGNYTLDKTFWEILDGNGQQTPVGVSTYEPKDGEIVTFNFTQGSCKECKTTCSCLLAVILFLLSLFSALLLLYVIDFPLHLPYLADSWQDWSASDE